MDDTSITPDPTGLKALSHPVRLRILTLLRTEGPATATSLATRLGLNSGATSYHLRQLAQYGFITDDAERGNGRERWWRAAHAATRAVGEAGDPEAMSAYTQAVAAMYAEREQRALIERPFLPDEWRRVSSISDWVVRLTPARAQALLDALVETIEAERDEAEDAAGSAHYVVQISTYPVPGELLP